MFARFRENRSRSGDYSTLLRFGDRKVYQEIARRFEATGTLDPGPWEVPGQLREAVGCGKNWAIPLMAKALERTEVNGVWYIAGGTHLFSIADVAAESFQKLTRKILATTPPTARRNARRQSKRPSPVERDGHRTWRRRSPRTTRPSSIPAICSSPMTTLLAG